MEEELEEDENDTGEQHKNSVKHLAPYQFKPGQSGNPSGRPKGLSMKEWTKNYLASLPEDERMEYVTGMRKVDVWKMAEGNFENKTDITSGGETINQVLVKFLDGKQNPTT